MRSVARIFAHALARRVAALLVAAVFAWLGIGSVHAQSYRCGSLADGCDQGEAYSAAWAYAKTVEVPGNGSSARDACVLPAVGSNSNIAFRGGSVSKGTPCVPGGFAESNLAAARFFFYGSTCRSRPEETLDFGSGARGGSVECKSGCEAMLFHNSDGTATRTYMSSVCNGKPDCSKLSGTYWNSRLQVCEPPEKECGAGEAPDGFGGCMPNSCPDGMVLNSDLTCSNKKNECPPGNIKAPSGACLPGDGQCASGEVRGKDGTCKRDADGDGQPDEGEDEGTTNETFSGGDNCNSPPACSGSPILCGQARIQWRIDCNTRKNRNISGGSCSSPPVCTGEKCDALEYSSLLMQWRTACALEKLSIGGDDGGDGSGEDVAAIRNALTGDGGTPDIGAEGNSADSWASSGGNGSAIQPDTSGYGWGGGSCPSPPPITVLGAVIQFDATPVCNWLGLGSYFVLGLAALASLRIVASKEA